MTVTDPNPGQQTTLGPDRRMAIVEELRANALARQSHHEALHRLHEADQQLLRQLHAHIANDSSRAPRPADATEGTV